MTRDKAGLLIALICAVILGLWPPALRAAYADGANVVFAVLMSTAARAVLLVGHCLWSKKPLFATRTDVGTAARGGLFQTAALITAIGSMAYIPGPVMITIAFLHTTMLMLFIAWRGEMRLDRLTVLTTLLALLGLTFVVNLWDSAHARMNMMGVGLALLSALATASRLYVFGKLTQTRDASVVGAETFVFALLFCLSALLMGAPVAPASLSGWGWMALGCTALSAGTFGMFHAIARIGSFRFSLLLKIEPVFTAIFSAVLISEMLAPAQYGGILLVIGSLAAYQWLDHRRRV